MDQIDDITNREYLQQVGNLVHRSYRTVSVEDILETRVLESILGYHRTRVRDHFSINIRLDENHV